MKKFLLIAAMAVMTLGAWAQSASDYGIVMEQPAGELRTYDRAGYAYYYSGEYIRRGAQTGTIDIVFGENNKVYFKQPLSKLEINSWIEGTLSDDGKTITVPMGPWLTTPRSTMLSPLQCSTMMTSTRSSLCATTLKMCSSALLRTKSA